MLADHVLNKNIQKTWKNLSCHSVFQCRLIMFNSDTKFTISVYLKIVFVLVRNFAERQKQKLIVCIVVFGFVVLVFNWTFKKLPPKHMSVSDADAIGIFEVCLNCLVLKTTVSLWLFSSSVLYFYSAVFTYIITTVYYACSVFISVLIMLTCLVCLCSCLHTHCACVLLLRSMFNYLGCVLYVFCQRCA